MNKFEIVWQENEPSLTMSLSLTCVWNKYERTNRKFLMLDSVWLVYSLIRNTHKKGILFDRNLNAVMSCAQIITYKFYTPTQKGCLQSMVWIHDHLFLFLIMANVTVHNVASWQCLILLGGHHNFYFASLGFC